MINKNVFLSCKERLDVTFVTRWAKYEKLQLQLQISYKYNTKNLLISLQTIEKTKHEEILFYLSLSLYSLIRSILFYFFFVVVCIFPLLAYNRKSTT